MLAEHSVDTAITKAARARRGTLRPYTDFAKVNKTISMQDVWIMKQEKVGDWHSLAC